ncbi:protein of unknown function [Georgfuchsia toluolica]|uniref:Uncharacterized protein n=1 Tax=Georgfuchsia toluolica TaxID=424218 RepID=A0A916J6W0_9PROT|nr:protein of unknown function [Georgfuchsia toluolica]
MLLQLIEQWKWIVVIDETHRLASAQGVEGTEDRGVPKALGDAAGIERVNGVGGQVKVGFHGSGSSG